MSYLTCFWGCKRWDRGNLPFDWPIWVSYLWWPLIGLGSSCLMQLSRSVYQARFEGRRVRSEWRSEFPSKASRWQEAWISMNRLGVRRMGCPYKSPPVRLGFFQWRWNVRYIVSDKVYLGKQHFSVRNVLKEQGEKTIAVVVRAQKLPFAEVHSWRQFFWETVFYCLLSR